MSGHSSRWFAGLLAISIVLIMFAAMIAVAAFMQEAEIRRVRRNAFPRANLDLATTGTIDAPLKLDRRRGLSVLLMAREQSRANEATLGEFQASVELIRRSDGVALQDQKLSTDFWRDSDEGSFTWTEFMPVPPGDHIVRVTIHEPAASLSAGSLEFSYVTEPMEGFLIGPLKALSGLLGVLCSGGPDLDTDAASSPPKPASRARLRCWSITAGW